jgi:hypothetical protein
MTDILFLTEFNGFGPETEKKYDFIRGPGNLFCVDPGRNFSSGHGTNPGRNCRFQDGLGDPKMDRAIPRRIA